MAKSYAERNAEAQEAGWESLYYQTRGRREARESLGDDASREEVWDYAEFTRDFDVGVYDIEDMRDIYATYFGDDYDDQDFYDWLAELYEDIA